MCCADTLEKRRQQPVKLTYPGGTVVEFRLLDEVAHDEGEWEHGRYHSLIQLLERVDGGERWIRFTYYRRPPGGDESSWVFAGQTSLATTCANWRALFRRAMEKEWFKSLLAPPEGVKE